MKNIIKAISVEKRDLANSLKGMLNFKYNLITLRNLNLQQEILIQE